MPKLTARAVEAAKPTQKRREIADATLPGLVLVVQPSGQKSYVLRYRHAGKSRRLTLGRHPVLGLADARAAARDALAQIDAGTDPQAEKRTARAAKVEAELSDRDKIKTLLALYEDRHLSTLKSGSEAARRLRAEVLPRWGDRDVTDIRRRDVIDLLDEIADSGRKTTANRVRAYLSRFFAFCVDREVIEASPAAGVRAPAEERPRDRVLSDDEIRWFVRACDDVGAPFGPVARFLLLTGQRLGEVAGMHEGEVKGDVWHLPADRTKNARPHDVPLTATARAIIDAAPRIAPPGGGSALIFTTTGAAPLSGWSRARDRLHAAMEAAAQAERGEPATIPHWTFHDLRRTCATGLARLAVPVRVTEAVLNHVSGTGGGIVGVYQRHDFAGEKRRALEAWADEVERIAAGREAAAENVVAFHG
jgi:integrase